MTSSDTEAAIIAACDAADARTATLPQTRPPTDTLPAWLAQRFDRRGPDWDDLSEDDRAYWEHEAAAVRRAVARDGFKDGGVQR